jgi:hypothetical protein
MGNRARRAKPRWAASNLAQVLWGKLYCAAKLGRPRAMISPDGPRRLSPGLLETDTNIIYA